jgi:hypothetical protein
MWVCKRTSCKCSDGTWNEWCNDKMNGPHTTARLIINTPCTSTNIIMNEVSTSTKLIINKAYTPVTVCLLFMCAGYLWKYSVRFSENNFIQNYNFNAIPRATEEYYETVGQTAAEFSLDYSQMWHNIQSDFRSLAKFVGTFIKWYWVIKVLFICVQNRNVKESWQFKRRQRDRSFK